MAAEPLTPANTTVILIGFGLGFGLGFGNVFRSVPVLEHRNTVLMLADLALKYNSGLVVINGPRLNASGPYYPRLLELLGDHPVIERGGMFNAFLFDGSGRPWTGTPEPGRGGPGNGGLCAADRARRNSRGLHHACRRRRLDLLRKDSQNPGKLVQRARYRGRCHVPDGQRDTGELLNLLADWVPDEGDRHQILVESPACLFLPD